ncbi:MAG: hypothetical protein WAV41_02775 [Microgenomates group bacterium]
MKNFEAHLPPPDIREGSSISYFNQTKLDMTHAAIGIIMANYIDNNSSVAMDTTTPNIGETYHQYSVKYLDEQGTVRTVSIKYKDHDKLDSSTVFKQLYLQFHADKLSTLTLEEIRFGVMREDGSKFEPFFYITDLPCDKIVENHDPQDKTSKTIVYHSSQQDLDSATQVHHDFRQFAVEKLGFSE